MPAMQSASTAVDARCQVHGCARWAAATSSTSSCTSGGRLNQVEPAFIASHGIALALKAYSPYRANGTFPAGHTCPRFPCPQGAYSS